MEAFAWLHRRRSGALPDTGRAAGLPVACCVAGERKLRTVRLIIAFHLDHCGIKGPATLGQQGVLELM